MTEVMQGRLQLAGDVLIPCIFPKGSEGESRSRARVLLWMGPGPLQGVLKDEGGSRAPIL